MKFKSKSWWKAAGIRAAKTTVQTLVASITVTAITREELRLALIASAGAGVLSFLNSMLVNLPEVEDEPDMTVSPKIEGEIYDEIEESDMKGGGVNE